MHPLKITTTRIYTSFAILEAMSTAALVDERLEALRSTIEHMKWDLRAIRNKDVRAAKLRKLHELQKELAALTGVGAMRWDEAEEEDFSDDEY